MTEKTLKRVNINIMGHQYSIRTDGDEAYIQEIADYVSAKSREVMEATQTVNTLDVFIKVAINLADELMQERAARESFRLSVQEASRELVQEIAAHLDGRGTPP
jgi:cell division protein ZapA (FtsZ GTPase activity inhibitor)